MNMNNEFTTTSGIDFAVLEDNEFDFINPSSFTPSSSTHESNNASWASELNVLADLNTFQPFAFDITSSSSSSSLEAAPYRRAQVAVHDLVSSDDAGAWRDASANTFDVDENLAYENSSIINLVSRDAKTGKNKKNIVDTPEWYEKYSSFVCCNTPDETLELLDEIIRSDSRCEIDHSDDTYQITGTVFLEERDLKFCVNIFNHGHNKCLIEFQRANGSVVDFQKLYASVTSSFKEATSTCCDELAQWKDKHCGSFNMHSRANSYASRQNSYAYTSRQNSYVSPNFFDLTSTPSKSSIDSYNEGDLKERTLSFYVQADCEELAESLCSDFQQVRHGALRALVLSSYSLKDCVFTKCPERLLSCLVKSLNVTMSDESVQFYKDCGLADPNCNNSNSAPDHETVRCVSAICANLCHFDDDGFASLNEEEQVKLMEIRKLASEKVVPLLLKFWSDAPSSEASTSSAQGKKTVCAAYEREADKQLIRLLSILYRCPKSVDSYSHLCKNSRKNIIDALQCRDSHIIRDKVHGIIDVISQE